jgi:hypothetical protein
VPVSAWPDWSHGIVFDSSLVKMKLRGSLGKGGTEYWAARASFRQGPISGKGQITFAFDYLKKGKRASQNREQPAMRGRGQSRGEGSKWFCLEAS